MTLYPGTKSINAEIILDFIAGTVTMDYSLNKFGSPYLNITTRNNSEWREAKTLTKLRYGIQEFFCFIALVLFMPIMTTMTILVENKIIKSPKLQYHCQNILRWCIEHSIGTMQQSREGILKDVILKFRIPINIWFSYKLSGEYQDKIKSISLLRNYITFVRFGKFREEQQDGWNIVFEFTDPPQHGSATITYV